MDLAVERIHQIAANPEVEGPAGDYFKRTAQFMELVLEKKDWKHASLAKLQKWNRELYEDIEGEAYEKSFANPSYACARLGEDIGRILSFLYTELRGCIVPLLLCGLLFAIGYNSEFMGPDRLFGAYMLMSVYGGWKFINRFCPFVFVWFSVEAIFWYFLIKVALSMLIGFFVTPVYLGYCVWRIWRLAF